MDVFNLLIYLYGDTIANESWIYDSSIAWPQGHVGLVFIVGMIYFSIYSRSLECRSFVFAQDKLFLLVCPCWKLLVMLVAWWSRPATWHAGNINEAFRGVPRVESREPRRFSRLKTRGASQ